MIKTVVLLGSLGLILVLLALFIVGVVVLGSGPDDLNDIEFDSDDIGE